jgi:hypothetical protein
MTTRTLRGKTPWPSQGAPDDPHEELCARQGVTYTCERGHTFELVFAATAKVPAAWDCRCGKPAGIAAAPEAGQSQHERRMGLALQRRSRPELEQLLADRLRRPGQTSELSV